MKLTAYFAPFTFTKVPIITDYVKFEKSTHIYILEYYT